MRKRGIRAASCPLKPRSERMHVAVQAIDREIWRDGATSDGTRLIPEETPIALTYNGGTMLS